MARQELRTSSAQETAAEDAGNSGDDRSRRELEAQQQTFGFDPASQARDIEYHFGNLVGDPGGAFGQVFQLIDRMAHRENETVLLVGETGTGKDRVAHAIHGASPRAERPLVATNFAALAGDSNLIQSELFGHEKGAFTGAVRRRRGCFELAHRSTLLIDEVGDVTPEVQVKLLRVLERSSQRKFRRLGGEQRITSDVRVLAATNRNLHREMKAGRFRPDLYYRLAALVIRIPPLRERSRDLPLLVRHFLVRLSEGRSIRLGRGVVDLLTAYPWPGNVRQLESVLLRALVMFGASDEIRGDDVRQALALEDELSSGTNGEPGGTAGEVLECPDPPPAGWFWEHVQKPWKDHRLAAGPIRDLLARHLAESGGYYTHVARRLGVASRDYQRFLDFLKHADLKVDHRPYRAGRSRDPA